MAKDEENAEGYETLRDKLEGQQSDLSKMEEGLEETLAALEGTDHKRLKKIYEEEFRRRLETMRQKLINEAVQFVRTKQQDILNVEREKSKKELEKEKKNLREEIENELSTKLRGELEKEIRDEVEKELNSKFEEEKSSLSEELDKNFRAVDELTEEIAKERKDWERQRSELEKENKELSSELEMQKKNQESISDQSAELQEKEEKWSSEREDLQKKLDGLEKEKDDLVSNLESRLESIENERDELQGKLDGIEEEDLGSKVESLEKEKEELMNEKDELASRVEVLERKRDEWEKEKKSLEKSSEKNKKDDKKVKTLERDRDELQSRLEKMESERDDLKEESELLKKDMESIKVEMELLRDEAAQGEKKAKRGKKGSKKGDDGEELEKKLEEERARMEEEFEERLEEMKERFSTEQDERQEMAIQARVEEERKAQEEEFEKRMTKEKALWREAIDDLPDKRDKGSSRKKGSSDDGEDDDTISMEEHKRILEEEIKKIRKSMENGDGSGGIRDLADDAVSAVPDIDLKKMSKAVRTEIRVLSRKGYNVTKLEATLAKDPEAAKEELKTYKSGVEKLKVLKAMIEEKDYSRTGRNIARLLTLFNDPANIPKIEQEIARLELEVDQASWEGQEIGKDLAILKSRGYRTDKLERLLEEDPTRAMEEFPAFLEAVDQLQKMREELEAVEEAELKKTAESIAKNTFDPYKLDTVIEEYDRLAAAREKIVLEREHEGKMKNIMALAKQAMEGKDYKNAQVILGKYLNEFPEDKEALELFDKAVEEDIRMEEEMARQQAKDKARNISRSNNDKKDKIEGDAKDFEALGAEAFRRKQMRKALEYFNMALDANPKYAPAWNNIGVVYRSMRKDDDAIKAYEKAVKLDPRYKQAWFNMGFAYREKGRLERCIECLNKAVSIDPKYREASRLRNACLEKLKNKNPLAYERLRRTVK